MGEINKICIVGLGYVGLPLAVAFGKVGIKVIGYDINPKRIEDLRKGIDVTREVSKEDILTADISFTTNIKDARDAQVYIIAVPTPITKAKTPNLGPIISAGKDVGMTIKENDIVVLESTVYPGVTEEILAKAIEGVSGLRAKVDFKLAYSPERINPGDKIHTLKTVTKVVGAQDSETAETIKKLYSKIVDDVFVAKDIKTAEASKLLENVQRSVNIGLMNEVAVLFDKLGIDIWDVLEAASTKWNFLKFTPGLVGGHCIPVDPYYLVYKGLEVNFYSSTVASSRLISDSMPDFLRSKIVKTLNKYMKPLKDTSILFLGVTYKENVPDTRSSLSAVLAQKLKEWGASVDIVDPLVPDYNKEIAKNKSYDVVIFAVPHKEFVKKKEQLAELAKLFIVDIKNIFKGSKLNKEIVKI